MRNALLILFISVFQAYSLDSYSQDTKVNLNMNHVSLASVLENIENNSNFIFLYNAKLVDVKREVSITAENEEISKILSTLFAGTGVSYKILDRRIVLSPGELTSSSESIQQQLKISGKVTDSSGASLPGVTVVLRGTTQGTITATDGSYSLANVPGDATLVFSFVGMKTQEIPVTGKTTINLVMVEEAIGLEEVVAIGYGTQSRALTTSSISTVKGEEISRLPVSNISQAISTLVPSITVSGSATERPGFAPQLRIRGESSINGASPLIIVDGVPSELSNVNPEDVESFTVLKDASSTAIYGARGSAGVILITTKSGKLNERIKISYNGSYSVKTPTVLPDMLDSRIFAEKRAEAEIAAGRSTTFNHPDFIAALNDPAVKNIPDPGRPTTHFLGTDNVDWVNEVLGNSAIQQHNIAVDGGGENVSYRVSQGYLDETAIYNYGDFGFKRYNSRVNLFAKVPDFIDLNFNVSFVRSENDTPVRGWDALISQTYQTFPHDPIKWDTGDWGGNNTGNAIQELVEGGHSRLINDEIFLNFNGELHISKNLDFNGLAGYRITHSNRTQDQRSIYRYSVKPGVPVGQLYVPNQFLKTSSYDIFRNFQGYFTYTKSFNDTHNIKIMAGGSFEDSFSDDFTARRQEYSSNDLMKSLDLGTGDQYASGASTDWAIGSFFGRLNYDYKQKYLLEASFRYDGSSRFTSENRWGFFPSVSAGWRIKEEGFLKDVNWLSDLKLRSSWGRVGNQSGIGLYDYITRLLVSSNYYPMGSEYGQDQWVVQNALASETRTWETIETFNAGIDFTILNNRLKGSYEYYRKFNKDMLVPVDFPSVIGFNVPTYNSGELKTWGWEATLAWTDKINNFKYGVSVTVHDSKNEITRFDRSKNLVSGTRNIEGYPLNSYFGYKTAGYFQSNDEVGEWPFQHALNAAGDVKYVDLDDSKKIDSGDVTYLGNPMPRYNFTVNLDASWKTIDFSATFEGIGKRDIYVPFGDNITYPGQFPRFEGQTDQWTENNRDALFPRNYFGDAFNWWISDRTIRNASFIRLKNVQIGYTLPTSLTEKIHLSNLRIYLNGRNLLTFDNFYSLLDTELTSVTQYPILKSFTLGLNLTF